MIINWFSPLPPQLTDIAHFTRRILPELSKQAQIRLWTVNEEYDPCLEKWAEVIVYDIQKIGRSFWQKLNEGDVTFYNIGNNVRFHTEIWKISSLAPGTVILHDIALQEFFLGIFYEGGNREDMDIYKNHMTKFYGEEGGNIIEKFFLHEIEISELSTKYPMHELACENSLGVIVHNELQFKELKNSISRIKFLPLPYENILTSEEKKQKEFVRKSIYKIIIFGYVHWNKRLIEFLEAFANFENRNHFSINLYGTLWDEDLVNNKIKELNLNEYINIHGFVSEEELQNGLNEADLAMNLRYPTMGEASGSQLRIWSHALPSLVSKEGYYATINKKLVVHIDVKNEYKEIQKALEDFLANPEKFFLMGQEAKKELYPKHSPKNYAKSLIDIVNNLDWSRKKNKENMLRTSSNLEIPFGKNTTGKNLEKAEDDLD